MRKHVLEYDDVMNKKRNVIYHRRRAALIKGAISEGVDVPFAREYGVDPDESMDKEAIDIIHDFIEELSLMLLLILILLKNGILSI